MSIFLVSDTHWHHRKILEYCPGRPFKDLESMNEGLIERWNSKVKPGDLVFHLGDFAFQLSDKREEIRDIIQRLNGEIVLFSGNHDRNSRLKELGIKHIYQEAYLVIDGIRLHIQHYPLNPHDERVELKHPKHRMGVDVCLHGHSHSNERDAVTFDNWNKVIAIDIGCDGNDCYPYSWEEIKTIINGKPAANSL